MYLLAHLQVSFWDRLLSAVRPLAFHIFYNSSWTVEQIDSKLDLGQLSD